jgi:hypothetical protein
LGGVIDFVFALIFPKQHPDKLVLPSLEVPRLLLRYTSNPDDHLWPEEVLSLGRYEHQTLEQHFPSIPYSGWRSIGVNKATYKGNCLTIFGKKGCEVSRGRKRTPNNFFPQPEALSGRFCCKGKARIYALIFLGSNSLDVG